MKLTKDPYLINDKYVHNKHLPVTEDQMQFLKADKFYALPDLYDRKDLPPYLRQPTTDLLIPKRISGGALFLLTLRKSDQLSSVCSLVVELLALVTVVAHMKVFSYSYSNL